MSEAVLKDPPGARGAAEPRGSPSETWTNQATPTRTSFDTKPEDSSSDEQSPNPQFLAALGNANSLLNYAASRGMLPNGNGDKQEPAYRIVMDVVITNAAAKLDNKISSKVLVSFWNSYSELSNLTKPVTAESIAASESRSLTKTKIFASCLVSVIIICSIILFASNSTATIQLI